MRWVYRSFVALGRDCDSTLELTRLAHAAAMRIPDPAGRLWLDYYATLATALAARGCGRDNDARAALEVWLADCGKNGLRGVKPEDYALLLVLAGDVARASGDWELAEQHLRAAAE
ncbi:MAG: hypothetical protein HZA52_06780 [Planctomycetes bacterium]|nr:hypothetical protein [Planctomycetota bacterium]